MDVVYHRNCLDGTYAGYLINLFCRVAGVDEIMEFMERIMQYRKGEGCELKLEKVDPVESKEYPTSKIS